MLDFSGTLRPWCRFRRGPPLLCQFQRPRSGYWLPEAVVWVWRPHGNSMAKFPHSSALSLIMYELPLWQDTIQCVYRRIKYGVCNSDAKQARRSLSGCPAHPISLIQNPIHVQHQLRQLHVRLDLLPVKIAAAGLVEPVLLCQM